MGRAEYINEDDAVINLADFKSNSNNQRKIPNCFPYKFTKRVRFFDSFVLFCFFFLFFYLW